MATMRPAEFRRIRKKLGYTQQRLADKVGAHRVTITNWERGALDIPRSIAVLMRLANERGSIPNGDK